MKNILIPSDLTKQGYTFLNSAEFKLLSFAKTICNIVYTPDSNSYYVYLNPLDDNRGYLFLKRFRSSGPKLYKNLDILFKELYKYQFTDFNLFIAPVAVKKSND